MLRNFNNFNNSSSSILLFFFFLFFLNFTCYNLYLQEIENSPCFEIWIISIILLFFLFFLNFTYYIYKKLTWYQSNLCFEISIISIILSIFSQLNILQFTFTRNYLDTKVIFASKFYMRHSPDTQSLVSLNMIDTFHK